MYPGLVRSSGLVFGEKPSIGVEPSATVLYDRSRYGNDGAFKADGEPDWVQLASGLWVLDFDGVDDLINCGSDASLDDLTPLTIIAWVNPASYGEAEGAILIKRSVTSVFDGLYLVIDSSDSINFHVEYDGVHHLHRSFLSSVAYNECQCFGVTWDGSKPAAGSKIYINGVEVASYRTATGGVGTRVSDAAYNLIIGNAENGTHTWDGYIALPRIYNYALSAGKIKQIFEAERHWFGV